MNKVYKLKTRLRYKDGESAPFKVSRSGIEEFLSCPRCFYLNKKFGVARPDSIPFNINKAVDTLLKKEFDAHRARGSQHPLQKEYGLDLVPFAHPELDRWRENFKGVEYLHEETNLLVAGAVDDVWTDPKTGELVVVDYKATSKETEVTLDAEWQMGYKRQMEIYQWLIRQNGFKVSDTGYFVYCNGRTDLEAFDGKIEFSIKLIPYTGDDSWVEDAIYRLKECLASPEIPPAPVDCEFCGYTAARNKAELGASAIHSLDLHDN